MDKKNCLICVYRDVCEDRKHDSSITDCCIPEKPLRQLQQNAVCAEQFIALTHKYINTYKKESVYWKNKKP